jgi:hypothetical protein
MMTRFPLKSTDLTVFITVFSFYYVTNRNINREGEEVEEGKKKSSIYPFSPYAPLRFIS